MKKIRDGLARIVNGIDKIERFLITVIFTEVIIVGFAQVVCRFILRTPLPWSEELLRFSFIWLTYTASSMGIMAGTHANVTVLTDRLSVKSQKVLQVFIDLLTAFFCAVVFYFSITQTSHPVLASKSALSPSKSRNFATSAGKSAKNSTMRA